MHWLRSWTLGLGTAMAFAAGATAPDGEESLPSSPIERLFEQLRTAPEVEIVGVVSEKGVAGAGGRTPEQWYGWIHLGAWRVGDGAVEQRPLLLRWVGPRQKITDMRAQAPAHAVIRVRARLADSEEFHGPQALLERFDGLARDAAMDAAGAALRAPVRLEDAVFGTFELDRRVDWYSATTSWGEVRIELHLAAESADDIERALATAHALARDRAGWDRRVQEFAVAELLPLKNESWLGEDESEFDAAGFLRRMRLQSITAYPDGSFEYWHEDGDLFWGHSILVRGTLADGPTDADIPG
jgi:hypothetical protein